MKNEIQGRKPIVCLDPGHYGQYNPGAVPGYYESEMNWRLAGLLKSELEALGVEVRLTKDSLEKDLSLHARGRAAKGADLFISIHSNGANSPEPDYPLAICNVDGSSDIIGKELVEAVDTLMQTEQAGRIYHKTASSGHGDWYTVLNASKAVGVPGVILEHSFHTNPKACDWLMEEENLRKMTRAEAEVIAEYFGMDKQMEPEQPPRNTVQLTLSVLKKGAKGEEVKALQTLLLGYGYQMKSTTGNLYGADGSFGGATDRAVREYQANAGLEVDGSVGMATWSKLLGIY